MNKEEAQPTVYGQPLTILEPNTIGRKLARQRRRGEVLQEKAQHDSESEWTPPPTMI